jgi:putative transcriptional regulator
MSLTVKNRLAECRAEKKIKKSQLAFRLQKSRGYITRLESGEIRPSLEMALSIARYFHKPVEHIFELHNSPTSLGSVGEHITTPGTRKGMKCN